MAQEPKPSKTQKNVLKQMSKNGKMKNELTKAELESEIGGYLKDAKDKKDHPQRVIFKLLPDLKDKFQAEAKAIDIPFTEYMRRALFAAEVNPDSLFSDDVEKRELDYKRSMKVTRWTKSITTDSPKDEPS